MNNNKEFCPHCCANLQGERIPQEQQSAYNSTHFTRKIGMTTIEADNILYWECPECGGKWDVKESYIDKSSCG